MAISNTLLNIKRRYSQSNPQATRNPWFLAWVALVVLVLTVNLIFYLFALSSDPGLVEEDYYEQGRAYERTAKSRQERQASLRWQTRLNIADVARVGEPFSVMFYVDDAKGLPLSDAQVQLHAYRPSDADADQYLTLEPIAAGAYQGQLSLTLVGVWELRIAVHYGDDRYELVRRIRVAGQ